MKFLALVLACVMAWPLAARAGDLKIEDVRALATPAQATAAGVFLNVVNDGDADRLTGAKTDRAGMTMIHTTTMDDKGVMKMRPVDGLDVPARGKLALAHGGDHIMLTDMKKGLVAGETFPLTLTFAKAGEMTVDVKVIAPADMPMDMQGHDMGHDMPMGHHE